ncbi:hypothetical protein D3C85_1453170 [compost metagenome]
MLPTVVALVFWIVRSRVVPPTAIEPSIVTLSDPLKLITPFPAFGAPEIIAATVGLITKEVKEAVPTPFADNATGAAGSVVLPVMLIEIVPVWVPAFTAVNAALTVV